MAAAHDPGDGPPLDDRPVRERLIRSTVELLAVAGPSELKVRTITDRAGVSTITVYHYFGGLQELLHEVVTRGHGELKAALVAATRAGDDPAVQLFAMALATRDLAQRNAHLYDMMFGLSTRGTYRHVASPDRSPAEGFQAAYAVLVAACDRLQQSGRVFVDGDLIAAELWSLVHGFITLEMAGHFAQYADPVSMVLRPMAVRHLTAMGDDPARAEAGAAQAVQWWFDLQAT